MLGQISAVATNVDVVQGVAKCRDNHNVVQVEDNHEYNANNLGQQHT